MERRQTPTESRKEIRWGSKNQDCLSAELNAQYNVESEMITSEEIIKSLCSTEQESVEE